jgi:membrane fusion protein, multidrug efflux system
VAGRVSEIGRLDPASHSFLVKVDLPGNPPLRSGMFGRAAFDGPARRAIVVPASAVVRRGQLAFVFTLSDGRARLRAVSVGPVVASGVEIAAGVSSGEAVVTAPPDGLLDGTRVTASGATP